MIAAPRRRSSGAPAAWRRFAGSTEMTLVVVAVIGFAALNIESGGRLLSDGNAFRTLFSFLAVPVLIGLAQLVVLAVGEMNLAVGALGGFIACAMAVLMAEQGLPLGVVVVIALALGVLVGAVNGLLVVATRITGFVVTLATMTILLGLQYRVISTRTVDGYSQGLKDFGDASVINVPLIFIVALVVAGLLGFFLARTTPGRRLLASGGNPLAARLSGVSNDRSIVLAHTLSGLIIAVAAIVTVASLENVNKSVGGDWLLPSFAAPIIGGVVLTGGTVSVTGTVLAAFIIRLVDTARAQFSLEPAWVSFVVGAVVLGTVVAGQVRSARQERARRAAAAALP